MSVEQPLQLPRVGFLRIRQIVGDRVTPGPVPISASQWWNWVKEGRAPAPIKLGPGITVWRADEIADLIDRLSEGNAEGAANRGADLVRLRKTKRTRDAS